MNAIDWLVILASYIIGLFPSAYLVARVRRRVNIRRMGDNNPGAANVSRNIGRMAGTVVLAADIAKGASAVLLGRAVASPSVVYVCGLAVVAGHNWPVLFRFKGGRGLAATIGVILALSPLPLLIMSLPGILTLWKSGNLIVMGVVTFAPLPLLMWWFGEPGSLILYCLGLLCFAGLMHLLTSRHLSAEQKREAIRWR